MIGTFAPVSGASTSGQLAWQIFQRYVQDARAGIGTGTTRRKDMWRKIKKVGRAPNHKNMKTIITILVVVSITVAGIFFGGDIAGMFENKVEYVTQVEKEVVVTDEFAEMVKTYKESKEGQEVLHTWATQKALEDTRKKLDEIEKQTLTKEASL